ncbi:TonB-dependent receptor [Sphingomonas flavalba]|uniref:TonB-dependent receptor n=1 Tax=Sphingomonas flavalba TaxID=2559804 RepID=UPI0039E0B593
MKARLLVGVSIIHALGVAAPALAQADSALQSQAAVVSGETIVVTARQSVDTSAETIKEQSTGIVDSITSEQIEKTVDLTLPEVLDRVVGVSSDGFYGSSEPGYVSLRGFDSRYNSMDIDGNPIWFSSQNNRGAQIGMFPSAIIKESSVYKTVTPGLDANSIGGHISMRTLRAFDGGAQPHLKGGYRIGFPERRSTVNGGPSSQIYGAGKFTFGADNQYGFVFGFNRQRTADSDDFGSIGGYTQVVGPDGMLHDQVNSNVFTDSAYDKTVRNTAVFAKLETRVEDKLYAFISGNLFNEQRNMYLQRSGPFISNTGGRTVTQTGPGQANFTNGQGQVREYDYDMQRKAKVLGFGIDYRVTEKGSLSIRGNYTDYSNDTLTRNIGNGFRLSNVNGFYDINGNVPIIRVADPATYNDPSRWIYSNSATGTYNRTQPLRDDVYTLGAVLNYNNQASAEGLGASGGVNWVRLDRSFDQDYTYHSLKSGVTLNLAQVTPAGSTMFNNRAAINNYDAFWTFMTDPAKVNITADESATADYVLREDVLAAHGAVYYALDRLKLVASLRYEHTNAVTDTSQLVSGVIEPQHRSKRYGNLLPGVHVSYDATSRLKLRAAFTKTLGRPDFADFAPGTTTTFDSNGVALIRGSNADIGPRVSTNYDASIEYYLDNGLLAVAVFQKDLKDEIFSQRTEIFDSAGMLEEIRTVPLNTGSAKVRGIELTASKRKLDFLPAPFDKFGISANYTFLDGRWDVVFTDGSTRAVGGLRNQPKWLANVQLSYDAGPLDVNINYRARGRTFTGSFGTDTTGDIWIRPYDRIDAQVALQVNKWLGLTFDAKNITNSYYIQSTGTEDSLYNSVGEGRSYWVGARLKY